MQAATGESRGGCSICKVKTAAGDSLSMVGHDIWVKMSPIMEVCGDVALCCRTCSSAPDGILLSAPAARARSAEAAVPHAAVPVFAAATSMASSPGLAFAPWAAPRGGALAPLPACLASGSSFGGPPLQPGTQPAVPRQPAFKAPPAPQHPAASEPGPAAAGPDPIGDLQRAQAAATASRDSGQVCEYPKTAFHAVCRCMPMYRAYWFWMCHSIRPGCSFHCMACIDFYAF